MKALFVHNSVGMTEEEKMELQTKTNYDENNIRIVTANIEFIDDFIKDQLEAVVQADLMIFDRSISQQQIVVVLGKWGSRPIYTLWINGGKSNVVDATATAIKEWEAKNFLSSL